MPRKAHGGSDQVTHEGHRGRTGLPANELGKENDALAGRNEGCETATGFRQHICFNRQGRCRPAIIREVPDWSDRDQLGLDRLKTGLMVQKPMPARRPDEVNLRA